MNALPNPTTKGEIGSSVEQITKMEIPVLDLKHRKMNLINRIIVSLFLFFSQSSAGILFTIMSSTLGDLAVVLNTTEFTLAYCHIIRPIGMIVGSFLVTPFAAIAEKGYKNKKWYCISFKKIFIISYFFMILSTWLTPVASFWWVFLVLQFTLGSSYQVMLTVTPTMLKYIWTGYNKNVYSFLINVTNLFYATGSFLFPLLVTSNVFLFQDYLSPRSVVAIINWTGIALCFGPFFILFYQSPEHIFGEENVRMKNNEKSSNDKDNESNKKRRSTFLSFSKKSILRKGITISGFFLTSFYITVDSSIWYVLFSFAIKIGYSKLAASYLSSIYFGSYLAGRITCSVFGGFWKANIMLFFQWGLMLIVLCIHAFIPYNKIMIWISGLMAGYLFSMGLGLILTSPSFFKVKLSANETSIVIMGMSFGNCFAWLTNFLMEYLSAEYFIYVILVVVAFGNFSNIIFQVFGYINLYFERKEKRKIGIKEKEKIKKEEKTICKIEKKRKEEDILFQE